MERRRRALPKLLGLQAFEATARLGSVSRAAAELSLTQGAVSRQLQTLEEQLGVPLFLRSKKRLILSEAGAGYLHDVPRRPRCLGRCHGSTRLETRPGWCPALGHSADVRREVARATPAALLRRSSAHHVGLDHTLAPFDFSIEQLDGAIHFGGREWSGAVTEYLDKEEMTAVAAPRLAQQCRVPADVLRAPLLQITSRAFSWRAWLNVVGLPDATITPYLQVETFAMGIEAVLAGICVGILPTFFVAAEIAAGSLVPIGPRVTSESAYYFVYPEHKRDYYPVREFSQWKQREVATT